MKQQTAPQSVGEPAIATLVAIEGTASVDWAGALASSPSDARSQRALTDAMHALCDMYGTHPGLVDLVAERQDDPALRRWIVDAAGAFTTERLCLAGVVAAIGPLPSTPGQAQAEAVIAAQRHALDMLARSDRAGCAIGAAVALTLDWHAIRPIVETVARRAGVELPASTLPTDAPPPSTDPRVNRARLFGARQLLVQQRGLWGLLQARSEARASH